MIVIESAGQPQFYSAAYKKHNAKLKDGVWFAWFDIGGTSEKCAALEKKDLALSSSCEQGT